MPGFGIVQGMVPIVGFNYGARFYNRVYEVIGYTSKLLLLYFTAVFLMVMVMAEPLFMLFEHDGDQVFVQEGARAFRIVALGFSFITYQVILSSVYQAMGFAKRAFIIALSRRFIAFLPMAFILTYFLGVEGIWWTFFAADLITGGISYLFYRGERKKLYTEMKHHLKTA